MFKFNQEQVEIVVSVKCPDGLCESLGYTLPKEIDSFIKFINEFSELKGYSIKLKRFNLIEVVAKLKGDE